MIAGRVPRGRHVSEILRDFIDNSAGDRVSLGDLVDVLRDRAFGALMLVFALPNIPPLFIPGLSSVFGTPMLLLAFQLMIGQRKPALPGWLAARSVTRDDFVRVAMRLLPQLERTERLLQPRWPILTTPAAERAIGALCVVLSIIVVLPLPFGNILPSLAVSIVALGLIEKDGLAVVVGTLVGLASIVIVVIVTVALVLGAMELVARAID